MPKPVLSDFSCRLRVREVLTWGCVLMGGVAVALALEVYALTYHPRPVERVAVVGGTNAPVLRPGQKLRILSWNVQYMAGKNHVFFYEGGRDERPSPAEVAATLAEVARVIREEDPDIILLQEVDDGSRRTDYEDQAARLLALLPADYVQQISAFYHKASFVPDRHILGAVGMKLVSLSKYRMREAARHQLPRMPNDPVTRQFYFKRAILEARLPVAGGNDFVVLNTHFDAWAAGTETPARQVAFAQALLVRLDRAGCAWCLGGDFNLLPPGSARDPLSRVEQTSYNRISELTPLFARYPVVPGASETGGADRTLWFTHFPNRAPKPDRTIDYLFLSPLAKLGDHHVRQKDPGQARLLRISDHFPVVVELTLPQ
jgi:endonuclease/exonuclease/phosphatase family metal-dependent hydrolase